MKIHEVSGLYVGYNEEENFRILISAQDKQDAKKIANSYRIDSRLEGDFEIFGLDTFTEECGGIMNVNFDCDYIVTYGGDC